MRPLKLHLVGVGPYIDETIDYKELGEDGLFLITGDTGSGKTIQFDGISYALYGEASNSERTVESLKSTYIDPNVRPCVELEFSHKGKEYKIKRSFTWTKPGTKTEKPTEVQFILPGGVEATGNTKVINKQIVDLIGIEYDQYIKLSMIAQGEFRKLLSEKTEDRKKIFEKLFATEKYNTLEQKLKDKNSQVNGELREILANQAKDIEHLSVDDDIKRKEIKENPVDKELLISLFKELVNQDEETIKTATGELNQKNKENEQVITDLSLIEQYNNLIKDIEESKQKKKELETELNSAQEKLDSASSHQGDIEQLTKEIPLLEKTIPQYATLDQYKNDYKAKTDLLKTNKDNIEANSSITTSKCDELKHLEEERKELEGVEKHVFENESNLKEINSKKEKLDELLATIKKLNEDDVILKKLLEEYNKFLAKQGELKKSLEDGLLALNNCKNELEQYANTDVDLLNVKNTLQEIKNQKAEVTTINDKVKELDSETKKVTEKTALFTLKVRECEEANHNYNHQYDLYLMNQAGILAEKLEEDKPCPVCGSIHHPSKAHKEKTVLSDEELKGLKESVDHLLNEKTSLSTEIAADNTNLNGIKKQLIEKLESLGLSTELEMVTETMNSFSEALKENEKIASEKKKQLEKDQKLRDNLKNKLIPEQEAKNKDIEKNCKKNDENLATSLHNKTILETQIKEMKKSLVEDLYKVGLTDEDYEETLAIEVKKASDKVEELNGEKIQLATKQTRFNNLNDKLIPGLNNEISNLTEKLSDLRENKAKLETEKKGLDEKIEELKQSLAYESQSEAQKVLDGKKKNLDDYKKEIQESNALVNECNKKLEGVKTVLTKDEKTLSEMTVKCEYDVKLRKQQLDDEIKALNIKLGDLKARIENNKPLIDKIEQSMEAYVKKCNEATWLNTLCATMNGNITGKDKIDLESYILSSYFDRVLQYANLRLSKMSKGQYRLERQKDATNKRSSYALGITVNDSYNNTNRDSCSLSGGESFLASLSLALGLADEISHSSGGIKLDTMYIDEGFGTLDDSTLNTAMNALTELASGDKLVGIISHVEELKNRIDKQIVVTKSKDKGSHVTLVTGR